MHEPASELSGQTSVDTPASPARSYLWLFALMAVFALTSDLLSKYAVFAWLYNDGHGSKHELIPGAFSLQTEFTNYIDTGKDALSPLRTWGGIVLPHVNQGALFGIGNSPGTGYIANYLFMSISLLAAVGIVFWMLYSSARHEGYLSLALGLILGGAVGNLYDRVVFGGVRDFLWWYYTINWPVFNVADCCLVCGASMLLVQALFLQTDEGPAPVPTATTHTEAS